MRYAFHPEAHAEFLEAIERYEERGSGLGYDFALEVYSVIDRIVAYPKTWPFLDGEIRRSLVRRFPYGVLYAEESDLIFIVAVMHLHRDPGYWKHRNIE